MTAQESCNPAFKLKKENSGGSLGLEGITLVENRLAACCAAERNPIDHYIR